ncbi:hypothetical protein [Burkholderia pyrrocinia]|uniref:hypothetical protein n=1 Tax=Burkholderia pyrrocinia TaxID=60550 RepID=UPI001BCAEE99|nr:hypothetical protein [Burkholderia pyrrocinia]QVN18740.1 hypothetical protein JYG32_03115 [Burkholderia pyrrocinia]
MDVSLLNAAVMSITAAKELGKAAIGLRDFNELAATVTQLNDQILKAQDSLFMLQGELFREQQKYFEAEKKVRELEKLIEDRGKLVLVDIGRGLRAYQIEDDGVPGAEGSPARSQPLNIFCQPCFDGKGLRSTLQPHLYMGSFTGYECRVCKERFLTGDLPPITTLRTENPMARR